MIAHLTGSCIATSAASSRAALVRTRSANERTH